MSAYIKAFWKTRGGSVWYTTIGPFPTAQEAEKFVRLAPDSFEDVDRTEVRQSYDFAPKEWIDRLVEDEDEESE